MLQKLPEPRWLVRLNRIRQELPVGFQGVLDQAVREIYAEIERLKSPEEMAIVADDIQRWHDIGQYEYVGPAQSVHLEAGERAYVQYRPTGRWFIVLPDPGAPQPGVTYKQAEKAGIEKAARYCIEVLADNHPHAANYFWHAAEGQMSYDEKCWTLGKLFLEDSPQFLEMSIERQKAHVDCLAQDIQNAIEDYLRFTIEDSSISALHYTKEK